MGVGRTQGDELEMPRTISGDAKRHPLNMRTTAEMREKLEAAAVASGRSLAQEVEYRLNASFADEGAFPHQDLKFWAYYMTNIFHQRGSFEASMRGHPDMTISEWMADPLIYQSAMFEVIRSMIKQQPRPERGAVEVQLAALAGLFHNLRNDLLGMDPLKPEGGE